MPVKISGYDENATIGAVGRTTRIRRTRGFQYDYRQNENDRVP